MSSHSGRSGWEVVPISGPLQTLEMREWDISSTIRLPVTCAKQDCRKARYQEIPLLSFLTSLQFSYTHEAYQKAQKQRHNALCFLGRFQHCFFDELRFWYNMGMKGCHRAGLNTNDTSTRQGVAKQGRCCCNQFPRQNHVSCYEVQRLPFLPSTAWKSGFSHAPVVLSNVNPIMTLTYFSTHMNIENDEFLNTEMPCCFPLHSCNGFPVVFARLPKCAQYIQLSKSAEGEQLQLQSHPLGPSSTKASILYLKKYLKKQLHHWKSNNFIWRVAPYFVHSATHSALPEVKRPIQLLMVALIGWQNLHQQCLTERYTAQARQSARHRSSSPEYLGKASGIWSNDVTNKSQKCQNKLLVVSKWQNNSNVAANAYLYRSIQFNDI